MMPLAPTPVVAVPSKPKIGFSIDSIVGGSDRPRHASPPLASPGSPSPIASPRSPSPRPLLRPSALPAVFPSPELKRHPYLEAQSHHHQFLAHFQGAALAAALAHQQQSFGGPLPPHPPPHPAAPVPRESYQLYPWLINRHGRIFPHRFPGGPDIPGFLLQPFRKPKRIRTAFSPSQLLKLEHAFEKNHYVVGAERKQLAQALSLTETQFYRYLASHASYSWGRGFGPGRACANEFFGNYVRIYHWLFGEGKHRVEICKFQENKIGGVCESANPNWASMVDMAQTLF